MFVISNVYTSVNENTNDHSLCTRSSLKQLLLVSSEISAKTGINVLDLEPGNEFWNQSGYQIPATNHDSRLLNLMIISI